MLQAVVEELALEDLEVIINEENKVLGETTSERALGAKELI